MLNLILKGDTFKVHRETINSLITNSNNTQIKLAQSSAPTVTDDNTNDHPISSFWVHEVDATNTDVYISLDDTTGAAQWFLFSSTNTTKLQTSYDYYTQAEVDAIETSLQDQVDLTYTQAEVDALLVPIQANATNAINSVDDIEINQLALQLTFKGLRDDVTDLDTNVQTLTTDLTTTTDNTTSNTNKLNLYIGSDFKEYSDSVSPADVGIIANKVVASFTDSGDIQPVGLGVLEPPIGKFLTVRARGFMTVAETSMNKSFYCRYVDDSGAQIRQVSHVDLILPSTTNIFEVLFVNVLTSTDTASQLIGRVEMQVEDGTNNHTSVFNLLSLQLEYTDA